MLSLILGGAASGKSAFAERWAEGFPPPRIYLATLQPCDAECRQRIARHRAMRAGKGFETVERPLDLAGWECPPDAVVLLECLGNLVANELYSGGGAGPAAERAVLAGIARMAQRARAVAVVSNQVFAESAPCDGELRRYLDCMAALHRRLALLADQVVEVVCGIPIWQKGGVGHGPVGGG